ncbi:hypothetical protein ACIQPR_24225 [Streptomyces sp. NPDC091280]
MATSPSAEGTTDGNGGPGRIPRDAHRIHGARRVHRAHRVRSGPHPVAA